MNKNLWIISAFIGGAVVGAAAALLYAPEKGSDTRARIKALLKSKGIDFSDDDVEKLVEQISDETAE